MTGWWDCGEAESERVTAVDEGKMRKYVDIGYGWNSYSVVDEGGMRKKRR